jgi:chlorophyllide a reductase subunit X
MADKLIIVCSNEGQSMYAANNIASAARYFANNGGRTNCLGLFVNKDDGSGKAARMAEALGIPVLGQLPLLPQDEVLVDGVPHPSIRGAVDRVIGAIDELDAVVPNQVDFVEFMMSLHGNASKMEGTAVSSEELWALGDGDPDPLAGLPNGGRPDHRYFESEDDAQRAIGPTIVSVGGGAVPAGAWER